MGDGDGGAMKARAIAVRMAATCMTPPIAAAGINAVIATVAIILSVTSFVMSKIPASAAVVTETPTTTFE